MTYFKWSNKNILKSKSFFYKHNIHVKASKLEINQLSPYVCIYLSIFRYGGIPDFTHRSVQYLEKKAKLKSKFLDLRKPRKSKNTHIFFTEESEMTCKKSKTLKKVCLVINTVVILRFICYLSCCCIMKMRKKKLPRVDGIFKCQSTAPFFFFFLVFSPSFLPPTNVKII